MKKIKKINSNKPKHTRRFRVRPAIEEERGEKKENKKT
jgi:hypothetical protein